jgi:hypothetical protein
VLNKVKSKIKEDSMKLKKGDRRRFLKKGAAVAGVAVGALRPEIGRAHV